MILESLATHESIIWDGWSVAKITELDLELARRVLLSGAVSPVGGIGTADERSLLQFIVLAETLGVSVAIL